MANPLLLAVMAVTLGQPAQSLPALQKIGESEMQVMFWRIYRAELFANSQPYNRDSYPQLLSITYLRAIEQQALLEATQDQWLHLGVASEQQNRWLAQLDKVWPDVKKGDQLRLLVDENQQSHFFSREQHLGSIDDPEFGRAFLDIWLSENTSHPKLRAELLGETP